MENKPQNKPNVWKTIGQNKLLTLIYFLIILSLTFGVLYLFNLVPSEFMTIVGRYPGGETIQSNGELPLEVKIPEVGVDTFVYNPDSTSTDVLNTYLEKGAVRYPGSGLLGGIGNVFLFGHSSGLSIVHNQAYRTFNGLKELKPGDLISVYSQNNEYVYSVTSVRMDKASDIQVVFDVKTRMLTLTSCNVWGAKEDRYIVEAQFVTEKPISSTQ
jgi:LPXTG-site transpeptidase (sortase) family protein